MLKRGSLARDRSERELPSPLPPEPAPAPPPAAWDALQPSEQVAALDRLHQLLQRTGATDPRWNAFRMIRRLLSMHSTIPPSMLRSIDPLVQELMEVLMPQLALAVSSGEIPPNALKRLVSCCNTLRQMEAGPTHAQSEIPAVIEKLERLLEALRVTVADLLERKRRELHG